MSSQIKLIASDMDHTLLTEAGELPPNFNDYVIKLQKFGVHFVIASGRPLCTLYKMFSAIKRKIIFIADNGGVISYKGKVIFKSLLNPQDYQSMIRFTKEHTDGIPVLCGLETGYMEKKHKSYKNYLNKFYSKIHFVEDFEKLNVQACKFTVYFPNKNSGEEYEKTFKPQYNGVFSVTVGDTIWIDIMNNGIDKGGAMRFLGDYLHLTADQMMAFGDTYNDIEMLQSVKHSYVVKNASQDMRRYANFEADSNENFGVIKILDKLIKELETPAV
ncbi:MAG: Cof-type HAD-IIB family hydrolase [Spirochaetaceae bacterium]|nr:Cof-type HAD-IIB family hydrolase [Spirochaetaceae bacterium]